MQVVTYHVLEATWIDELRAPFLRLSRSSIHSRGPSHIRCEQVHIFDNHCVPLLLLLAFLRHKLAAFDLKVLLLAVDSQNLLIDLLIVLQVHP